MRVCLLLKRLVAEDLGEYYRVPADTRDLNYSKYFDKGQLTVENVEPYTSHNTEQLTVEGLKKLLLSLEEVQSELDNWHSIRGTSGKVVG